MQRVLTVAAFTCAVVAGTASLALDRGRLEAFLETTGFDVSLESIRLSAESAPAMLGMGTKDFGDQWTRLAEEVFDVDLMQGMALDILDKTLEPDVLDHAQAFYASGLGQRIVQAENASHLVEDEDAKSEAGQAIFAALVQHGSDRVESFKRMLGATESADSSVRAVHEIQIRFLMAAAVAEVIELRVDEDQLRDILAQQEPDLRRQMQLSSLASAAYTYQAFSDEEVDSYAAALEHPHMKDLYALMNAVQYEVMANRFETLAGRLADLTQSSDL
ncbi:DUF2059 domain-containing protein [Aliishimia ponticola]|uniref:DUF2059 domain-containing protein n=1 Tax=Aliishimia ponticola TaxID=2499833 RepID=A0A4S4NFW1_9RHOB|nr:DUF2059 domain-containing protein [Aliishimia ponticola]THH38502.1 DUF2059 domain-containing protein [Aliishimia ponticola]